MKVLDVCLYKILTFLEHLELLRAENPPGVGWDKQGSKCPSRKLAEMCGFDQKYSSK